MVIGGACATFETASTPGSFIRSRPTFQVPARQTQRRRNPGTRYLWARTTAHCNRMRSLFRHSLKKEPFLEGSG